MTAANLASFATFLRLVAGSATTVQNVPVNVTELVRDVNPSETVLLLGAGASVPSGGKTGQALAEFLCDTMSQGVVESDDLSEAASLLEAQYGRPALVEALARELRPLQPDGGLLSLMSFDWARIYTTNYDELVERARKNLGLPLRVIRNNLDFGRLDSGTLELLKIHGCITRDRGFGNADSMILTERDYHEYDNYREALFAKLLFDLHTKNVLIIGQSLKDRHLRDLVDRIAALAKKQGTANKIHILVYAADAGRMRLLQERNLRVASGSMSQLADVLQDRVTRATSSPVPTGSRAQLPRILLNRTVDVEAARAAGASVQRMFGGGSASYADIDANTTFERTFEHDVVDHLLHGKIQFLTIIGASGVGKTTAGRRIMRALNQNGHKCFEHVDEFPFAADSWFEVGRAAHAGGRRVFLMIDDAPRHLSGLNRLANRLADENIDALSVVMTAHTTAWSQRSKTGVLRRLGREETLGQLDERELDSLVSLVRSSDQIRGLLEPSVSAMTREQQLDLLGNRASADMFVALKFLFSSDSLDAIVLKEFAELDEDVQEIYKVASLLEATYAHASRQLILEVLDLDWSDIPTVLDRTKGVLHQKLVDSREGLYVWRTRHPVIAQVIAGYKYIDQDELYFILRKIVERLNSAMLLDRYVIPNLCDTEWGIGRLADLDRQITLFELLTKRSTNRVPWHRLIALWLERDLTMAEATIRRAVAAVGVDSPIARYEIKLTLARAEELSSLGTDDYIALILDAAAKAEDALDRWPDNKYSHLSLIDVGEALMSATGNTRLLEDAIEGMTAAYDEILDDQMLRWRQRAENLLPPRS